MSRKKTETRTRVIYAVLTILAALVALVAPTTATATCGNCHATTIKAASATTIIGAVETGAFTHRVTATQVAARDWSGSNTLNNRYLTTAITTDTVAATRIIVRDWSGSGGLLSRRHYSSWRV